MDSDSTLPQETDVLIVGAGPVGLAVAIELALRKIPCVVVEKVPEIKSVWTRAMNVNMRSMEHMRRWNVAEELKNNTNVPPGWPANVTFIEDGLCGRLLASTKGESLGWHRTLDFATEDSLWIAQGRVQKILMRKAAELGAKIMLSSEARALDVREDGKVDATIGGESGDRRITARFVVGCDGGRGVVRKAAGMSHSGLGPVARQVAFFFRAPGLLNDLRRRGIPDSIMYFSTLPDVAGVARLVENDEWEFNYRFQDGEDEHSIDPTSKLARLLGPDLAFEFTGSYPYTYLQRIATQWMAGPIFVAGDAAHIIPPLGGHNLNLGFGDAVNLGWKLAHVVRGWADKSILDSYEAERLPMVWRTAREAQVNFERLRSTFARLKGLSDIKGDTAEVAKERTRVSGEIATDLHPQWVSYGTVLDLRYTDSPIIMMEEMEVPNYNSEKYQPFAAPGHRAPMHRDDEGVALYDRFGPEYTLLDLSTSAETGTVLAGQLAAAGLPVQHLRLKDARLISLYEADHVLIRPDQHVAWRGREGSEADAHAISEAITQRVTPEAKGSPIQMEIAP